MRHVIPFFEAAAAAAGASVLREEDGVTAHGRLLTVIRDLSGRKTGGDEILRVTADLFKSCLFDIGFVVFGEMETRSKRRSREFTEGFFYGHKGRV